MSGGIFKPWVVVFRRSVFNLVFVNEHQWSDVQDPWDTLDDLENEANDVNDHQILLFSVRLISEFS